MCRAPARQPNHSVANARAVHVFSAWCVEAKRVNADRAEGSGSFGGVTPTSSDLTHWPGVSDSPAATTCGFELRIHERDSTSIIVSSCSAVPLPAAGDDVVEWSHALYTNPQH